MYFEMQNKLIIFSGPSGSGKTTIVKHLVAANQNLKFSISACSREKRDAEIDGKDYYFFSKEEFHKKITNNEFIEWEEVYPGQYYGTLRSEVEKIWSENYHVIFDVDVIGGLNLKKKYPANSLAVFIQVPSMEALELRLRARLTESEASINKRLNKAREETSYAHEFDIILINDRLEDTLVKAQEIVNDFIKK